MKKTYCDRCGREMEQSSNILLRKTVGENTIEDYFDLCDICRDALFGWLNNKPAEQEKPVKIEGSAASNALKMVKEWREKASKEKVKKESQKPNAYTAQYIAEVTGAPVTTVRRHAEGICSTYGKGKKSERTIRYYHMTEKELADLIDRIKARKQGRKI